MNLIDFCNKYYKIDHIPDMPKIDKFIKGDKQIIMSSGRCFNRNIDILNLLQTANALLNKKRVVVATKNIQRYINDMQKYLNLKISFKETKNNDLYNIYLD